MEYSTFVRKPFQVRAVKVTEDNIAEIAKLTGDLMTKDDGTVYIEVDRKKVPNLFKVYVGFFMTKMDNNLRCYPPQIFEKLFVPNSEDVENWIKELNGRSVA